MPAKRQKTNFILFATVLPCYIYSDDMKILPIIITYIISLDLKIRLTYIISLNLMILDLMSPKDNETKTIQRL